ncbi:MAG: DNA polymerase IV [Chloroflexi bacterium]|nr:DNA polymerase IV [Chloroflexota bacterium]
MEATPAFTRWIIHADLDAFFASVEQRDHPELRGKPVLVGGDPRSRGVVAACSYEARAWGIRSAMPMRTALQVCPQAIVVQPRFGLYRQVSHQVMETFRALTPLVEPMSLDEAYLDVSEGVRQGAGPMALGRALKARVKAEVRLTLSVGIATSKAVAKIASALGKPDGLVLVEQGREEEFLAPLPVGRLPGIGPKTEQELARHGIRTLGELGRKPEAWAQELFGKRGPEMLALCRGQDERPVVTEREAKSMGAETTFATDLDDPAALARHMDELVERVAHRLGQEGVNGRTITVKLRLSDFTTFTRSSTLPFPVNGSATIRTVGLRLLERELLPGRRFRLLGVSVSNFGEARQLTLFGEGMEPGAGARP